MKHGILKKLRRKKEIVVLKPDKGNGVVILDRTDYVEKIFEIVNDTGKFKTIKREGQLQTFLRKLKKENCINNIMIKFILKVLYQPKFMAYLRSIRILKGFPHFNRLYPH